MGKTYDSVDIGVSEVRTDGWKYDDKTEQLTIHVVKKYPEGLPSVIQNAFLKSGKSVGDIVRDSGLTKSGFYLIRVGKTSPNIKTLMSLAKGMGMRLKVSFEPVSNDKK